MANVEHNTLTGANCHEPKGADTASSGQVYVADGLGSGSFQDFSSGIPSNVVVVNTESDFPAASGGVITLAADTLYILGGDISTSNRFAASNNSAIIQYQENIGSLTTTTTGAVFTGTNVNFALRSVSITADSASAYFSFTDNGLHSFEMIYTQLMSAIPLGTMSGFLAIVCSVSNAISLTSGFDLSGNISIFSLDKMILSANSANACLDLNSAVFTTFELTDVIFQSSSTASGAIGISGLTSDGNLAADTTGDVVGCNFSNVTTPISGISVNDLQWNFRDNDGDIQNSTKDVDLYLTVSTTITVTASSTFYPIGGSSWASDHANRFSVSTSGVATYDYAHDTQCLVIATATISKVGGGTDALEGRICLNGSTQVKSGAVTQNANPTSITMIALETLTQGDVLRIELANNTTTADIVVDKANMTIINGF